jgi:hypothetical protein
MNPEGGYTRQYRRLWENEVFRNKQEAAVFSWLKDAAAWRPTVVKTRFRTITLGVGELLINQRAVAEDFGLDRKRLRSLLQRMVEAGMIALSGVTFGTRDRTTKGTTAGTIVTIRKYAEYQGLRVVRTEASGPEIAPQSGPEMGPLYINKDSNDSLKKENPPPPPRSAGGRTEVREDFRKFYEVFPKHVGEDDAYRKYRVARRTVDAVTLLVAAKAYAEATREKDPQYVACPATWLRGGRWKDAGNAIELKPRIDPEEDARLREEAKERMLAKLRAGIPWERITEPMEAAA